MITVHTMYDSEVFKDEPTIRSRGPGSLPHSN